MTVSPINSAVEDLGLSEATRAQIAAAEEDLGRIQRMVTQRDWLNITQRLDRTRKECLEDGGLRLLALAWVREKAAHGGASWDVLLDMTDEDLLALHGFPTEDEEAPQASQDGPQDAEGVPAGPEGDPARP